MIIIYIMLSLYAFMGYIWIRQDKVYDFRVNELDKIEPGSDDFDEKMAEYESLPSFDKMVLKFWVWPISRFKNG